VKRPLPPAFFLSAIVLSAALHFLLPLRRLIAWPWCLVGIAPIVPGIVLNLLADRAFKKHNTTVKPFEESAALVTNGVFAITRNPMYLGMTLILLGIAVLLGSASPFIVVIVLPILFDRTFIAPEEKMLEDTFGDRFSEYRRRVRRWI